MSIIDCGYRDRYQENYQLLHPDAHLGKSPNPFIRILTESCKEHCIDYMQLRVVCIQPLRGSYEATYM